MNAMMQGEIGQMLPRCTARVEFDGVDARIPAAHVAPPSVGTPWRVLVIDDEESVHGIAELLLSDFSFDERGVEVLHAYSGAEAMAVFGRKPDIAVALVDVAMVTDRAGLDVVRYVREVLDNRIVRLILLTGQQGSAPDRDVIARYDINDYKAEVELSAPKLYSAMTTALRGYRDITDIEAQRLATSCVVDVTGMLFQARSLPEFAALALEGFLKLMESDGAAFYTDDPAVTGEGVLASVGAVGLVDETGCDRLADRLGVVADCAYEEGFVMVRLACRHAESHFICAEMRRVPTALDRQVAKLFRLNATSALDNLLLLEKNQLAQRQAIRALAKLAPYRHKSAPSGSAASRAIAYQANRLAASRHLDSADFLVFLRTLAIQAEIGDWDEKGSARHVARVGRLAGKLAELAGMDRDFCEAIVQAGELHDVGKMFVVPSGSSGWFEPESDKRILVAEHAIWGAEFLRGVSYHASEVVRMAGDVALYHHEMWNGHGYPAHKAGEAIPIAARIVAIVDFFDQCISPRSDALYRVVSPAEAVGLVETAGGVYFDPRLASLFVAYRQEFIDLL